MRFNNTQLKEISKIKNGIYRNIIREFLFHSNKLEGSTFSRDNIESLLESNQVKGEHSVDDVLETLGSVEAFSYIVDTVDEPITKALLCDLHKLLKSGTNDDKNGLAGVYKKYQNEIYLGMGKSVKTVEPYLVEEYIDKTIDIWNNSNKTLEDIADFHFRFETIHPFQDGNGRIGRFIIMKQCVQSEIDLIVIDSKYKNRYKEILNGIQSKTKDKKELYELFRDCQVFLDSKKEMYEQTMEQLKGLKPTINRVSAFDLFD